MRFGESRRSLLGARAGSRWWIGLLVGLAALGVPFFGQFAESGHGATPACPQGATLNLVAHQDDDLLFLSPDLLHDVQAGRCVRTVFLTAGDGGGGQARWVARENGSRAAYARMAGAQNAWLESSVGIGEHQAALRTLEGHPGISLVFLRLPDGWLDGAGTAATGNESLQKLWQGSLADIHAVDGSTAYTRSGLIASLTSLLQEFQPDTIRTQDFEGAFGDGDHSDHHAAASFVREAERAYGLPHELVGYQDYGTKDLPQNVFGADLAAKHDAFFAYLAFDESPCGNPPDCSSNHYGSWLARQYRISGGASSSSGGGGGGAADLRLSGTLDAPRAPVGDGLVWRLRVDDTNGRAAVGAYVDVDLPAGVEVATATTDRGPGCTPAGPRRLHCNLDYLSADSPVGNVLLITRVTMDGELVLSATTGFNGRDPVESDNTIELRANVPSTRPGPLLPPTAPGRPGLKLSSVSCSVGGDGVVTALAAVTVDRAATLTATARSRRTGRILWSLAGSKLGRRTLAARAPRLRTVIAGPKSVALALRVGPRAGARPCSILITVSARADGSAPSRLRFATH